MRNSPGGSRNDAGFRFAADAQVLAADASSADAVRVVKPPELVHYLTGADEDAPVQALGPGLVIMGGSREVDDAFRWWMRGVAQGDVVILRTSGSDGYNEYLYSEIGGADSVETLLVTSRELANSDYVVSRLNGAEGIFLAGGNQSTYMNFWKNTKTQDALNAAWQRGAMLGGTSAGCAVLGAFVFAAYGGGVDSESVMRDPFHSRLTLDTDFVQIPFFAKVITDSHFAQRDRMGRLISFMARVAVDYGELNVMGLGVDERTALTVDASGLGEVRGTGAVYVLRANQAPQECVQGETLTHDGLSLTALRDGDQIQFPAAEDGPPPKSVGVQNGTLVPANPY